MTLPPAPEAAMTRIAEATTRPAPVCLLRYPLVLLLPILLLAGCASQPHGPTMPVMEEQADYQAHARSHYTPPGPDSDPWGPYINEAANRFDVPAEWIRAIMHQESGGRLYDSSGHFITSTPGAMGLMQIMPPAYDDLRAQYNLGPDPYDPHDNILAGAAYIRQMYEIYGSPGFLAAYNYGPGSLDHYLRQNRALPRETRNYVAAIAPGIVGIWPHQRSRNDLIVARHDRTSRLPRRQNATPPVMVEAVPTTPAQAVQTAETQDIRAAWAARGFGGTQKKAARAEAGKTGPAQDEKRADNQNDSQDNGMGNKPEDHGQNDAEQGDTLHIRSIPLADAPINQGRATDMPGESLHDWAIQLGSYAGAKQARMVATKLRPRIAAIARNTTIHVMKAQADHTTLYRARLADMTHSQAIAACKRLHGIMPCVTVPPGSHF